MWKFTLWILTLILTQNTRSQRYYYAQIGNQYDIYYGPRAIENYKEVKPPKSYKTEYGQRAERPGVCYEANFSCTNRKYPVSETQAFECLEDFQCPRYYKCCQPVCFQHKICQPAIIPSSTEETTQSSNNKFGGNKFSTQNKPEIATIKSTESSTLNEEKMFDEWLKQNSNLFSTSFYVYTQSNTVQNAATLFHQWVKENTDVYLTTFSPNIDGHSASITDIQKALEEIPRLHSTTPFNVDNNIGKQTTSVQNTDKLLNTPDRLSSKSDNIFHTSETPLMQTTPISLAFTTTQNNIDKILLTTDDENILEEIEGSGDYLDQEEGKEGTNNVNQIINEIFKNSTEIPVEEHARKTNKIPKETEDFLFKNVKEMQTEANEKKKITTFQMYSTSAGEKIKEFEDSSNDNNENKRNNTAQIQTTDINYTTNKIINSSTRSYFKDTTKENKNKPENITEKMPKEDKGLFFTELSNYIPDKKFTEHIEEILKTTDDESIFEKIEGSGNYDEHKDDNKKTTVLIRTTVVNHIINEKNKKYTKIPDKEFKKETNIQDILEKNEDLFFTNTQHNNPDKNSRTPDEILKTTANENIFEKVDSSGNNNEHKQSEKKASTDYKISTNFKNYTKKTVEEHKSATTQNMAVIFKITNDENVLDEIEGSGNYDENERRTTVQLKSTDKNTIVKETFKSYTEKPTKERTIEPNTEKNKNASKKTSKENEYLFFTNIPSDGENSFKRNIEEILQTTDDESIFEFTDGSGDYYDHEKHKLKTTIQMDFTDIDEIIDNIFQNVTQEPIQTQIKQTKKGEETTELLKPEDNRHTEFIFENDNYTTLVFLPVNTSVTFLKTDASKHIDVQKVTLEQTVTLNTDYHKSTVNVSNQNSSTDREKKELSTKQITASSKYATAVTFSGASNRTEIENNLNQNTNFYLTTPSNVNRTIDSQKNSDELFEEWLKQNFNFSYTTPFSVDADKNQQTGGTQDFQELFKKWLKYNADLYLTSNSQERSKSTTKQIFTNSQDRDFKDLFNDWLKENPDIYWATLSDVHTTANKQVSNLENIPEQFKEWLKQNPNFYLSTPLSITADKYTYNTTDIQKFFKETSKLNFSPTTPLSTDVTINEQTNNIENYQKFKEWLKKNPDLYLSARPNFTKDTYTYHTTPIQKLVQERLKENLNSSPTTPLNTYVAINEQANNIENGQKFEQWIKENKGLYLTTGGSLNSQESSIKLEQYLATNSYKNERQSTLPSPKIAYKENNSSDIAKIILDENQEKYNEHEESRIKNNITNTIVNSAFNTSHDINLETSIESTKLGNSEGEVAACLGETSTKPKPTNESGNKPEAIYKESQSADKEENKQYGETVKSGIKNVHTFADDEDSIQEASGDSSGDYEIVNDKELE